MQHFNRRLMLAMTTILSTRLVYALAYQFIGKQIDGPNQYLVPLIITEAVLVASWLAIWSDLAERTARFWSKAGISLFCAALAGILGGYIAMAVQREPKTGMFTIFIVGGLAWCALTAFLWSRNLQGDTTMQSQES